MWYWKLVVLFNDEIKVGDINRLSNLLAKLNLPLSALKVNEQVTMNQVLTVECEDRILHKITRANKQQNLVDGVQLHRLPPRQSPTRIRKHRLR